MNLAERSGFKMNAAESNGLKRNGFCCIVYTVKSYMPDDRLISGVVVILLERGFRPCVTPCARSDPGRHRIANGSGSGHK